MNTFYQKLKEVMVVLLENYVGSLLCLCRVLKVIRRTVNCCDIRYSMSDVAINHMSDNNGNDFTQISILCLIQTLSSLFLILMIYALIAYASKTQTLIICLTLMAQTLSVCTIEYILYQGLLYPRIQVTLTIYNDLVPAS